jgi:tetratricopeptide (TPR) repeat protein
MQDIDIRISREPVRPPALLEKLRLHISARLLRRLLKYFPNDARALTRLGNVELLLGDFARAEQTYKASLACEQDQPAAQFRRGIALERLDRAREALQCYKLATSLEPSFKEASERRKMLAARLQS